MSKIPSERRHFIKSTALSIIGISTFGYASAEKQFQKAISGSNDEPYFYRYPGMHDNMVSAVVGASHFNFDRVKELVGQRPELAGAAWDWGFGDFETALGAASHVGRRDIAEFLMSHGARPDIFTFTMLGMITSVKEIIETVPGIQSHNGPHGITLLAHAKNRLRDKNITASDKSNVNAMVSYLDGLGNADIKATSLDLTEEEKQKFIGEFRYGDGEGEILVVDLNSQKNIQIARKGSTGRSLSKVDIDTFSPAGAPSVKIIFKLKGDKAISFGIHEPDPLVKAIRI